METKPYRLGRRCLKKNLCIRSDSKKKSLIKHIRGKGEVLGGKRDHQAAECFRLVDAR